MMAVGAVHKLAPQTIKNRHYIFGFIVLPGRELGGNALKYTYLQIIDFTYRNTAAFDTR